MIADFVEPAERFTVGIENDLVVAHVEDSGGAWPLFQRRSNL